MKLGGWQFDITTTDDDDTFAEVRMNEWAGPVKVYVNPKHWRQASLEERRLTIVHELLHVHMLPYRVLARNHDIGSCSVTTNEEQIVGTLSQVIAPHMPLPGRNVKC